MIKLDSKFKRLSEKLADAIADDKKISKKDLLVIRDIVLEKERDTVKNFVSFYKK